MLNVDGHVFQQHYQASENWAPPGWRKNRRPNLDGTMGVDLNRNYAYNWGWDNEGSSAEGLDETYRGTNPYSEPETDIMRQLAERQKFVLAVSYHSFDACACIRGDIHAASSAPINRCSRRWPTAWCARTTTSPATRTSARSI
jgi:hypothetical protein